MIEEVKSVLKQHEGGLITDCELAMKLIELASGIYHGCQCGDPRHVGGKPG